jgi:hypothetical protein
MQYDGMHMGGLGGVYAAHGEVHEDGPQAVGYDGLMDEVMAMQANLQELESDLLQLGCGFDE